MQDDGVYSFGANRFFFFFIFFKKNNTFFFPNSFGQCATGDTKTTNEPIKVMENANIKSIVLGEFNSFYIESKKNKIKKKY